MGTGAPHGTLMQGSIGSSAKLKMRNIKNKKCEDCEDCEDYVDWKRFEECTTEAA